MWKKIQGARSRQLLQWGVLGGLMGGMLVAQAEPTRVYTIDPSRSELVVQLFKAGIGAAFAHDHVVRATAYTGTIHADPATPTTAAITVEVQAAALRADEPAIRQKYGLQQGLSDDSRERIQAAMEAAEQLNVAQYPSIRFQSTRVQPLAAAEGHYTVSGDLTIRGMTQRVTFPVRVEVRHDVLHGWGSLRVLQSSFGYKPYSAAFGTVQNKDEVLLHFDIIAAPK